MRSKMARIVSVLCVCGAVAALVGGCNSSQSVDESSDGVSMGVVNDTCPVMPEHAVDPEGPVAEYHGTKVGFCCAGCPDKWEAMSDAEKEAYIKAEKAEGRDTADITGPAGPPAANMGVINATCPVMGGKVNQAVNVDYKGQKVGFCCAGCIDEWNAMSDEEKSAFINSAHDEDANLGAVGSAKEGACDGAKPCCTEGEKPAAPETVNPGVIGEQKEGACGSGGCCGQKSTEKVVY